MGEAGTIQGQAHQLHRGGAAPGPNLPGEDRAILDKPRGSHTLLCGLEVRSELTAFPSQTALQEQPWAV